MRDSAALLDAVAGTAVGDPYSAPPPAEPYLQAVATPPRSQRILMATASPFPGPATDPAVVTAVQRTASVLEELGHAIEAGTPRIDADAIADAVAVLHTVSNVALYDLAAEHLGRQPREDDFEPSTWVMIREGLTTSGAQYAGAIAAVHAQTRRFAVQLVGFDALLVPTLLTPPPPYRLLDQPRATTRAFFDVEFATTGWTSLANVTGWAAISVPVGETPDGLPIGVQLMAPDEEILLKLAAQLEVALPWAGRRPAGWIGRPSFGGPHK
ncbi:hypothetical protein GCM10009645_13240 [Mycolicibacterium poriferae]